MKKIFKTVITVLGFFAAMISVYKFILEQNKFDLTYEIITNSDVIEVKSAVSDLHISYSGVDLLKENKKLQVLQVRIKNTGNETILSNYYDENNPLGIEIINGGIIENPIILNASNKYLKYDQKLFSFSDNKIIFSKIIIEPGESFDVKILLVANKGVTPKIKAIGRVAGINNIQITDTQKTDKNSLEYIFNNLTIWDFLIYLMFFGTMFYFMITSPKLLFGWHSPKSDPEKESVIKEFNGSVTNPEDFKTFINYFKSDSLLHLNSMNVLTDDMEELNNKFSVYETIKREGITSRNYKKHWHLIISNIYNKNMIGHMINLGLVKNYQNILTLDINKKNALNIFLSYLEKKGYMKKSFVEMYNEDFLKNADYLSE